MCLLWFPPCSQKDLENLKAEVQRRQMLQEATKSEEPEPSDDTPTDMPVDD